MLSSLRILSFLSFVLVFRSVSVSFAAPILLPRKMHAGDGTFYDPALGACGITNKRSDFIAAASYKLFDTLYPGHEGNPNKNPICKKWLTAHYKGKKTRVQITDRCAGCEGEYDLDFSPAAFDQLADEAVGRLHGVEWEWDS